MYSFKVPEDKKINIIIDSDAKNEADDQYAIVHALLSPKIKREGNYWNTVLKKDVLLQV